MRIPAAALLALLAAAPAAADGLIRAAEPGGVAEALRGLGYRAQLDTDSAGDPMVVSAIEGLEYTIWFYGCTNGAGCESLLFSVGLDLPEGVSFSKINVWNQERLFGKAYVDDENDPFLVHFLPTEGGITAENFVEIVEWWGLAVSEFTDHVGF
jgi:hypothetical protein